MINSSFAEVADQILLFNKNLVEILTKLNNLSTTTNNTVNVQMYDSEGVIRNYTLPSFTSLKSDIDRLNNNINALYNIDSTGSLIQSTSSNKFKKIITVDLNSDPSPIGTIGSISTFKSKVNWFFDNLVDPMMQVDIDLSSKIENNVHRCLVRRYIIDFDKTADGLTQNGQSALNSFNELFRDNSNILLSEFENWHSTTPGVVEPLYPRYDEDIFELEPNTTLYDGEFSVLRVQEDTLNRKLWYVVNTLDYVISETNELKQLKIGDELIVNISKSSTRYKILEISTGESSPMLRFERVEGIEPISIGIGTLKIYSPVIYTKNLRVSIGYNERNILFIKPINSDNNLAAKKWSLGSGFFTNDLRFSSYTSDNGITMENFYTNYVYDYGESLKDMVSKKIPNRLAGIPLPPKISIDNFKVVQINKHLTNNTDKELIKKKHNYQLSLKSEIKQLENSISDKNKKLKLLKFNSESDKTQFSAEISDLVSQKETKSKLLTTVTNEILDNSKSTTTVQAKFRLRGFWDFPDAISTRGTFPQEIIQFRIQYKYVNLSDAETPIEEFDINGEKASFSNWVEFKSDVRKRIYDSTTDSYYWQIEDIESSDTPNINQLDIPIQSGEKVEFRIKSISEVGWPESPVESTWSDIYSVSFPEDLNTIVDESDFILEEAKRENLRQSLTSELKSNGLDEHLSDTISVDGTIYHHDTSKILSGFKDDSNLEMNLYEYLIFLQNRIKSLEELISKSKGVLEVIVLRNNQEFAVNNGSEISFNIECEDYLEKYTGSGVPTGRVYENNIYVIKDYVVKIRNTTKTSPLGLLSNKTYLNNQNVYNTSAPQTFWVNEQDELLRSDLTSQTKTHLNNQYIWMVNYDSISDNTISKLSDNIGNLFISNNSNSVTNVLSSSEYNIGYLETSILSFVGNNDSLLDPEKWIDQTTSVSSTNKLLTTIHPVIKDLESIVENNSSKVKELTNGNDITIPINIYFKMNSLDTNQSGLNYQYINIGSTTKTIKHIKKVKFLLENESENRPFTFTLKFNINRNKVIVKKTNTPINENIN